MLQEVQMKIVQNLPQNTHMLHSTLQNKHPFFYSLFILKENIATDDTDYQTILQVLEFNLQKHSGPWNSAQIKLKLKPTREVKLK